MLWLYCPLYYWLYCPLYYTCSYWIVNPSLLVESIFTQYS